MELVERDLDESGNVPAGGEVGFTRRYYVLGNGVDPTMPDVISFLSNELPRTYGNLRLTGFDPSRIAKGLYEVDASYGMYVRRFSGVPALESNTGANSYTFSFSTGGATYRTNVAKEQTTYDILPGVPSVDIANMLNWNGQSADGLDIVGPKLTLTIRKRMQGAIITLPYIRTVVNLTGKTNNAAYFGFAAGELLFLGADGSMVPGGDTELTFNFSAAPNVASAGFNGVTITDIGGHDYLHAFVLPGAVGVVDIRGVYKARLYDSADFTQLRI